MNLIIHKFYAKIKLLKFENHTEINLYNNYKIVKKKTNCNKEK